MDWQRFAQSAAAAIVRSEKKLLTGVLEIRVQYRNGIPRRGHLKKIERRVLNREPIPTTLIHPLNEFEKLTPEIVSTGANADSEISISYSFFSGSVVDITREVLNIMC